MVVGIQFRATVIGIEMTILVAEDAPVDAIVMRNILEHAGHTVVVADNGNAAMEALEKHPGIALVVADVRMPGLTGVELYRAMQERPALAEVPVVFVSGVADAATVRETLSLGSAGYILKPVNEPSRVLDRVNAALADVPPILEDHDVIRRTTGSTSLEIRELRRALAHGVRAVLRGSVPLDAESARAMAASAGAAGAFRLARVLEQEGDRGAQQPRVQRELEATAAALPLQEEDS